MTEFDGSQVYESEESFPHPNGVGKSVYMNTPYGKELLRGDMAFNPEGWTGTVEINGVRYHSKISFVSLEMGLDRKITGRATLEILEPVQD